MSLAVVYILKNKETQLVRHKTGNILRASTNFALGWFSASEKTCLQARGILAGVAGVGGGVEELSNTNVERVDSKLIKKDIQSLQRRQRRPSDRYQSVF